MTTNKNGAAWLAEQIELLQQKETLQTKRLKYYAGETVQSLKPFELVKSAISGIATSPNFKQNILDTSIGIGAGLIARKWYVGTSDNIFKKIAGFLLQNITTAIVAKKMPGVRDKISHTDTK
jgi:hypothetical protein